MKQIRPVVYSGKVGAKMRPVRHTVGSKKINKQSYKCQDGPWKNQSLYLESGFTLTMTIKGQTGRYNQGKWECTSPQP